MSNPNNMNMIIWNCQSLSVNPSPLDKMATISQTIFLDTFSWVKSFGFWLKFNWYLFLSVQSTITHHWFRKWFGAEYATSHYLNQCWQDSLTNIWHQAITWRNVDILSERLRGIHLTAISQLVSKVLFCITSLKIIFLKLLSHLPKLTRNVVN